MKDEGYWSNPSIGGYVPPARCFFAMDSNAQEIQNQVLVLGGKTYDKSDETAIYLLAELGKNRL